MKWMRITAAAALLASMVGGELVATTTPADAVVYCKRVGYPRGCVAAPARPHVVYCKRVGYPKGCVMR